MATLTTGQRLHLIDEPAFAVLVDDRDVECSDRHPGRLWVAFRAPAAVMLFRDDEFAGSSTSVFTVKRPGSSCRVRVMVGDDHAGDFGKVGRVWRGDTVNVDWNQMFGDMA